jgi:two-component system, LytTR family, sensor kinase
MASIINQTGFKVSIAIGLVFYISIQLFWLYFNQLPIGYSFVFSGFEAICLLASLSLIGNNLNYYRPQKFSFGFLIAWCLFFGAFSIYLPKWLFEFFFSPITNLIGFLQSTIYIRLIFNILLLLCFSAFCWIWYNFQEYNESAKQKEEALALNREAELFKLKLQLQPHFLFNSLNSVNALITSRPAEARKMVQQLSDFLRYTIKKEDNQLVELNDELEHLALYLDIEKVRFGHRLNTIFHIDENTKPLLLPVLLLQPILENAIKFGLYDTIEKVDIEVMATFASNNLIIKISNPFDPKTGRKTAGASFGLKSVAKRLQLIYFQTDLLKTSEIDNTFITEIIVPQK